MFNVNKTQKKIELAKKIGIQKEHLEEVLVRLVEIGVIESDGDIMKVVTNFKPNQRYKDLSLILPSIRILHMIES